MYAVYEKDMEKSEKKRVYEHLMTTVFFFTSQMEFDKCLNNKVEKITKKDETVPLQKLLNQICQDNNVKKEKLLFFVRDEVDISTTGSAIAEMGEALRKLQESESQHEN